MMATVKSEINARGIDERSRGNNRPFYITGFSVATKPPYGSIFTAKSCRD